MDMAKKDTFLMSCLTMSMNFEAIHSVSLPYDNPKQIGDISVLWDTGKVTIIHSTQGKNHGEHEVPILTYVPVIIKKKMKQLRFTHCM